MNIPWIVILSISFTIIYSNLEKLNEIVLWFLPLGGALLLVNAFFWIKYIWKLLKKIYSDKSDKQTQKNGLICLQNK